MVHIVVVNGYDYNDIILANSSQILAILCNQSEGIMIVPPRTIVSMQNATSVVVDDLNNDGLPDILDQLCALFRESSHKEAPHEEL